MCVVSNIGDYFDRQYPWPMNPAPWKQPYPKNPWPDTIPVPSWPTPGPTKEQFEEFLELLRQAIRFDKVTGQPDCQTEDKLAKVKAWGKTFGIDIDIEITDND